MTRRRPRTRLARMKRRAEDSQKRFSHSKPVHYWTHAKISIEEGLRRILLARSHPHSMKYQLCQGVLCVFAGNRLATFLKGTSCVECGVRAAYFSIQRDSSYHDYHLNLYAIGHAGEEVMMTSDHIQPKSKGGTGKLANRQPMCSTCNNRKGNKWHPQN